mmetsp:Transcript_32535/g.45131  ORF Transcript_32535/g.45131 Transcript_32535/m.45131 type:complete len:84 (+) Transcript_32535:271-522(+)
MVESLFKPEKDGNEVEALGTAGMAARPDTLFPFRELHVGTTVARVEVLVVEAILDICLLLGRRKKAGKVSNSLWLDVKACDLK